MCDKYVQTSERSSMGKDKDACLLCGRTKEAHLPPAAKCIKIWFQGKMWTFNNWEEAREKGFHLG